MQINLKKVPHFQFLLLHTLKIRTFYIVPVARISKGGGGVLFGGKVDLKPKGEVSFGKKWTFVLYSMEPLAFGPPDPPPPPTRRRPCCNTEEPVFYGISLQCVGKLNVLCCHLVLCINRLYFCFCIHASMSRAIP